jgi:elongation factor P hydroxylase
VILYHGSTDLVDKPEIRSGEVCLDFGAGFYTTTSYTQAERWARIKMRRKNIDVGYVSVYEFDAENAEKEFKIKKFECADESWLLFVVANRKGDFVDDEADMHIGPVADDNVYQSIRLFETGIMNAEETVKRLKTEVLHDQWTFHTDKILSYCRFVEYKEVR